MRSVPLFLVVILAAQVLGNRRVGNHDWIKQHRRFNNNHYRRNYNDDNRPMDFSPNWDDYDDRPMDFSPNWDDYDDDNSPDFSRNWYDDDYNDFGYNRYNRYNFRRGAMTFSGKKFTQMLAAAP
ncbi:unnamed protein product [Nippostrongylus brasiliensis]|uniref:Sulfakinin n=1 Tax=Nippostrongylus brasiliensis TaxID=27835 RepID=A0A0N4YBK7_NIPBR|nr:hypothetical protein Q1695_015973 [Nippostrongylus brasiliensis]VDL77444.1 unnamed protein product [Nippostrongylus brasiliensis]